MSHSNNNLIESKRWFLKLTALVSVLLVSNAIKKASSSIFIDDDIVIVNGWILLKSDFK